MDSLVCGGGTRPAVAARLRYMDLICFPSSDALSDLALVLHARPARAWLAVVDDKREGAARLERLLGRHGIEVGRFVLPGFSKCNRHADVLVDGLGPVLESAGQRELVLALGGSAGPWELVCQQVLRGLLTETEFRMLALVDGARRVARIAPGPVEVDAIPNMLSPDDYLTACNATLRQSASDEQTFAEAAKARRRLTFSLAHECEALGSALGMLNYHASDAVDRDGENLVAPKQHLPRPPARPLRQALERMAGAELLDFDGGQELIFRSAEACRYVAGGWMEEYAWLTATELGAEHVHAGLELTWNARSGVSPRNELDLFVLHRNRALTVECKTSDMGQGDTTARILYKLDSIADRLSSLPGNAVLLSAREVPELIVKRARAQGVAVFDAGRVVGFRGWLEGWLAG